jgi:hypothetical protein
MGLSVPSGKSLAEQLADLEDPAPKGVLILFALSMVSLYQLELTHIMKTSIQKT